MVRVLLLLLLTGAFVIGGSAQTVKKKKPCAGCPTTEEVEKILRDRYEARFTEGWMKGGELRIDVSPIEIYPAIRRKMDSESYAVPVTVYPVETTVKIFVKRPNSEEKMEYLVGAESEEKLVQMSYFRKDSTGKTWMFNTDAK